MLLSVCGQFALNLLSICSAQCGKDENVINGAAIKLYGINQSMNSDGGRCHDNVRCESMWARLKEELFYGRYDTEKMTVAEVKELIWRYFMSYWNNRRICSSNEGFPPLIKRRMYYDSEMDMVA